MAVIRSGALTIPCLFVGEESWLCFFSGAFRGSLGTIYVSFRGPHRVFAVSREFQWGFRVPDERKMHIGWVIPPLSNCPYIYIYI